MSWLTRFFNSTIGLKAVMAVSGLLLFGFVLGHMAGNLQVFLGPEAINGYGEMLQGNTELLWGARFGLLALLFAHMYSAVVLTKRSKGARPVGYKKRTWSSETYAVRTMRIGGVIILLFIVYHLLHLTVGVVHPDFVHCSPDPAGGLDCDPYHNLVTGFSVWWVSAFYMLSMAALAPHLAHGVWSLTRTLGLDSPRYDALVRRGAWAFAGLIFVGNCSIPLAVLTGIVK